MVLARWLAVRVGVWVHDLANHVPAPEVGGGSACRHRRGDGRVVAPRDNHDNHRRRGNLMGGTGKTKLHRRGRIDYE